MHELFGLKEFFDANDFVRLVARLALDLGFAGSLVLLVHYRRYRNRDMAFTYLLFNVVTFSLCFLLRKVPIELGFALGMFAVFGILRYRTEPIRTRDLSYLFIVTGLAILNAVANKKVSFIELVFINGVIVGLSWLMADARGAAREEVHHVVYDNLSLVAPGKRDALIADLTQRTGMEIIWVEVGDLDLLRDTARLTMCCRGSTAQFHGSGRAGTRAKLQRRKG